MLKIIKKNLPILFRKNNKFKKRKRFLERSTFYDDGKENLRQNSKENKNSSFVHLLEFFTILIKCFSFVL